MENLKATAIGALVLLVVFGIVAITIKLLLVCPEIVLGAIGLAFFLVVSLMIGNMILVSRKP